MELETKVIKYATYTELKTEPVKECPIYINQPVIGKSKGAYWTCDYCNRNCYEDRK